MKFKTVLLCSTVFLAAILCQGYLISGDRAIDIQNANQVIKADDDGNYNIIIKFKVPDISRLTESSNSYPTGLANTAIVPQALEADLKLQQAIYTAGDQVLFKLTGQNYSLRHRYETIPFLALAVSDSTLNMIQADPDVLEIFEDKPIPLPKYERENQGKNRSVDPPLLEQSLDIIGARNAWQMGFTGNGWYVAVLDTGIKPSHEMFSDKTIVEQCYSLRNDCPNGLSSMAGAGAAAHYDSSHSGWDHGTHVAGIAAGNNKSNKYGVAKDANIIAVQVFSRFSLAECSSYGYSTPCVLTYSSDQIRGLEFIYQQRNNYNIAAVNMSLGGGFYSAYCNSNPAKAAVDNLAAVGIATAIASGNDGYCTGVGSPSCIQSAVTVGASTKNDQEASFSNWHPTIVDLMAPGQGINSSTGDSNQSYQPWNGTSMATPHIAGTWAIFKQVVPTFPVTELLNALKADGTLISTKCGGSGKKARINIATTLAKYLVIFPPANFIGEQIENKSLTQTEYVNVFTWESNAYNDQKGQNIVNYRLYLVDNGSKSLLQEFASTTFLFWHRNINKDLSYTYAMTSVNSDGLESPAAFVTIGN